MGCLTLSIPKGGEFQPLTLGTFLSDSKAPQDNGIEFFHFNLTPLRVILHTLTTLVVLRCCHGNLLFPSCDIIFWNGKMKNLSNFQDDGLIIFRFGGGGISRL